MEAVFECEWGKELPQGQTIELSSVFGSSSGAVCAGYTLSKSSQKWEVGLLLNGALEVKNLISYPQPAKGLDDGPMTIHFTPASAALTKPAQQLLDELAASLKANPALFISLEGHTHDDGKAAVNLKLSKDRVDAVYQYLVARNVDPKRMSGMVFGETMPAQSNQTAAGKAANRRVEIHRSC